LLAQRVPGNILQVNLTTGEWRTLLSGLTQPYGIAIDDEHNEVAFVTDTGAGRIILVSLDNHPSVGSMGSTINVTIRSGLNGPSAIALSADRMTAFVTCYDDGTVLHLTCIWDTNCGVVDIIATGLDGPMGIALSADGLSAFVADADAGRVVQVNLSTGVTSTLANGFSYPVGIIVRNNSAFVTDTDAGRVVHVSLTTGANATIASGLSYPQGIAFSADGMSIFVVENTGSVVQITTLPQPPTSPLPLPFMSPLPSLP
jgi:sugar lactone lactonase YvrE